jgi:hypothetical protein
MGLLSRSSYAQFKEAPNLHTSLPGHRQWSQTLESGMKRAGSETKIAGRMDAVRGNAVNLGRRCYKVIR